MFTNVWLVFSEIAMTAFLHFKIVFCNTHSAILLWISSDSQKYCDVLQKDPGTDLEVNRNPLLKG